MTNEARALRERIHEAIEAPVEEAEKLLSELTSADTEAKLSILVSGWGRGLAAALEELAIAIDELRQASSPAAEPLAAASIGTPATREADEQANDSNRAEPEEIGEDRLLDEAKKSREATAELREETEQVRRELEQ